MRAKWISKETWQLADLRAALQISGRAIIWELGKARRDFQGVLQAYRHRRVQAVGISIECFLETGRVKEAWDHLAPWYLQVQGNHAHPTREGLDQYLEERA